MPTDVGGGIQVPEKWTARLRDFATYLEYERGASENTLRDYGTDLRHFFRFLVGNGVERLAGHNSR